MNVKKLAAVAVLGVGLCHGAFATPTVANLGILDNANASFSGSLTAAGPFNDVFTFQLTGNGTALGGAFGFLNTVISSVSLLQTIGGSYTSTDNDLSNGFFFSGLTDGTYSFTVTGTYTGALPIGVYGGTIGAVTTPVPEPATLALGLAALGLLGAAKRRRSV